MIKTNRGECIKTYIGNKFCGMYIGKDTINYCTLLTSSVMKILIKNFPDKINEILKYVNGYPELVPFINEDPMIVCSLGIEGLPIRWLVGDGKAYCNTGIFGNQNFTAKARAKMIDKTSVSTYQCVFGARVADMQRAVNVTFMYPSGYYTGFGDVSEDFIEGGGAGVITDFELSKYGAWINREKVMNGTNNVFTTPNEIALFSRHDQGALNARPLNGAISYVGFGGDTKAYFVPFLHGNQAGMIDLVSLTFHPNANSSGSFTIEYTLQDGSAWIPIR